MLLSGLVRSPQDIIRRNLIIVRELNQMPNRKLVGTALISCIHGLRCSDDLRNLSLRFVVVFSQITKSSLIVHGKIAHGDLISKHMPIKRSAKEAGAQQSEDDDLAEE